MKVAILGGGQLARMLALAGHPMGLDMTVLCPAPQACAAAVARHVCASFIDELALQQLADEHDLITYEFENVPADSVEMLNRHKPVYPPPVALATGRDRLQEKTLFNKLGIGTAPFAAVNDLASLQQAINDIGLPAILKTRTEGYDGKGQVVLRDINEAEAAWDTLKGVPAILEGFVEFEREVSIIAVRSVSGELAFYPLSENVHRNGILHTSTCCVNDPMQTQAETYATKLLQQLDYAGVLAIEFFHSGDELLVNEFAPRVHNSGHWTIEGSDTSQFENHLRAIMDLPLGSTQPSSGYCTMLNLVGDIPQRKAVLQFPRTHLHLYGKSARPGRKVGHVTLLGDTREEVEQRLSSVLNAIH